ncbi:hypothetical protein AMECASPLE_018074 [Ameca splendens]|uniref:Secreted protein n=1 Tax=Ameca splendens TaxID=208324 RepID=A0ABV0YQR5_9TELE
MISGSKERAVVTILPFIILLTQFLYLRTAKTMTTSLYPAIIGGRKMPRDISGFDLVVNSCNRAENEPPLPLNGRCGFRSAVHWKNRAPCLLSLLQGQQSCEKHKNVQHGVMLAKL